MTNRTLTASLLTLGTALALGTFARAEVEPPRTPDPNRIPGPPSGDVKKQGVPAPQAAAPTGIGALAGRPDAPATVDGEVPSDVLGPVYENRAAGMARRPP